MTEQNVNSVSEGADKQNVSSETAGNATGVNSDALKELQQKIDAQNDLIKSLKASSEEKPKVDVVTQEQKVANEKYDVSEMVKAELAKIEEAKSIESTKKDLSKVEGYAFDALIASGKTKEEALVEIKGTPASEEPKQAKTNTSSVPVLPTADSDDGNKKMSPQERAIWIAENRGKRTYKFG